MEDKGRPARCGTREPGAPFHARPGEGQPRPAGRSAPPRRLPRRRDPAGPARPGRPGGRSHLGTPGARHLLGGGKTGARWPGEPRRARRRAVPRTVRGGPRDRDPDREADPRHRRARRRILRRRRGAQDPRPRVPHPRPACAGEDRARRRFRRSVLPRPGTRVGARPRGAAHPCARAGARPRAAVPARSRARHPGGRSVRVARRRARRRAGAPATARRPLSADVAGE